MPVFMTLIYRTDDTTRWGFGTGADLDPVVVDLNFWQLYSAVKDLQDHPPAVVEIAYFSVSGSNFYVHMTDHTTLGPYPLPNRKWNFRSDGSPPGTWVPLTTYTADDVFSENGSLYIVLINHTSAATFDPNANDGSGHNFYQLLLTNPADVLPTGGAKGMRLAKKSATNLDSGWFYDYLGSETNVPTMKDVEIISPFDDGSLMQWNAGSGFWHNVRPTALAILVSQCTDVDFRSLADKDVPHWDAATGKWVNAQPPFRGFDLDFSIPSISLLLNVNHTFNYLRFTNTGGCVVTVPSATDEPFAVGTEIAFRATTDGVVSFAAAFGVTLNVPTGFMSQILCRHGTAMLKKVNTNEWDLMGLLGI